MTFRPLITRILGTVASMYDIENPDKILVALAVQEKRRREAQDGVRRYIPHFKQSVFHKSTKKVRALFGGNRSGKSVAGTAEGVWWATGLHPYRSVPIPNYGRVCTVDITNYLERIIIPEYKKWIPKEFLKGGSWDVAYKKESRIVHLTNGSTIEFMSYDQDLEKFGGSSRHWVHEDEECPSDKHYENMMRLVDTGGALWMTMTPLKGMTWVYSDIYEKAPNSMIDAFVMDIMDNPHLAKADIDDILSTFPQDEIDARAHGRFIKLSGVIYKEFSRQYHVIPFRTIDPNWRRICAIDPHPQKPTAVLWMAVTDNDDYIVYNELMDAQYDRISKVAEAMHQVEGKNPAHYRLIDSSASTPDPVSGVNIKREFERCNIRTTIATKDVDPGINSVHEVLALREDGMGRLRPRLFFMDNCVKTIHQMEHYIWDTYRGANPDFVDAKGKPLKKNDDLVDCLRYICMSRPSYNPPSVYRPQRKTVDREVGY